MLEHPSPLNELPSSHCFVVVLGSNPVPHISVQVAVLEVEVSPVLQGQDPEVRVRLIGQEVQVVLVPEQVTQGGAHIKGET
jgi:hypothetical protein